ncbi:MAG: hypothetical protein BroJett026_24500 [Betaproteobacteria bacterium]|nr:MAG: hypothetical protein BroJett026_24500 [Betaproteobacteria bacterium]
MAAQGGPARRRSRDATAIGTTRPVAGPRHSKAEIRHRVLRRGARDPARIGDNRDAGPPDPSQDASDDRRSHDHARVRRRAARTRGATARAARRRVDARKVREAWDGWTAEAARGERIVLAPLRLESASAIGPTLVRPRRPRSLTRLPEWEMVVAMRVVAKSSLNGYWERAGCADARGPLHSGYEAALKARRRRAQDIEDRCASASICCNNRVVFNVGGNRYRLVGVVQYPSGIVRVKFVGTRAQCDCIDV